MSIVRSIHGVRVVSISLLELIVSFFIRTIRPVGADGVWQGQPRYQPGV